MKYVIANWKANLNLAGVQAFIDGTKQLAAGGQLPATTETLAIVAPTSIFYTHLKNQDLPVKVGLQDISPFAGGAYTGEVTPQNLNDCAPEYIIVGHSERRREYHEDNALIVRKAQSCWALDATPIICFDEPEAADLSAKLQEFMDKPMILAYEPVSAISTSGNAGNLDPALLSQKLTAFRQLFPDKEIIYGGSVKADNADGYADVCDGLLVGSASLQADSYWAIVKNFSSK